MRMRAELKNLRTFSRLVAAISNVEKLTWACFNENLVQFTVFRKSGTQAWASLSHDLIFEKYEIESGEDKNTINFEISLRPLQLALRSAENAVSASLRLTNRKGKPMLAMTIVTNATGSGKSGRRIRSKPGINHDDDDALGDGADTAAGSAREQPLQTSLRRERDKVIVQDIPVRVLRSDALPFMQPHVRETDVHIELPPLRQLKAISDRFTRLLSAAASSSRKGGGLDPAFSLSSTPRLELSANMHGGLRVRAISDTVTLMSQWSGLPIPIVDPSLAEEGSSSIQPSTRFAEAGPDCWASVFVDGRDWSKVLGVGRLNGKAVACFSDKHTLVLYFYVEHQGCVDGQSVITYHIQSYIE